MRSGLGAHRASIVFYEAYAHVASLTREAGPRATVAISCSARSGKVSASIDGRRIADHKLDLIPGDMVQLRVAAKLQGADAKLGLLVRRDRGRSVAARGAVIGDTALYF